MLTSGYNLSAALKVLWTVMHCASRVSALSINFLCPCTAELRAAVTTSKITNIVEIDFYITGHNIIFETSGVLDLFKVHSGPGLA
jgi:hypothetical protein